MVKQRYERKKSVTVCGVLDVGEQGEYFVRVEEKESSTEYNVKDILDDMVGSVVTFSAESYLE